jgi:cell division protein FtsI (penicillin-binding protein 3)
MAAAAQQLHDRALLTLAAVLVCFAAIGGQLVRLAVKSGPEIKSNLAEPMGRSWSRPDIVDRNGALMATDVAVNSLYADPHLILDLDEVLEKVSAALPGLDASELRKALADRSRRFAWIARGLTPRQAKSVHELGLPGLGLRTELKRTYPLGALAGHVLGSVTIDNRGLAGIERMLDETAQVEPAHGPARAKPPVRLSLDIGAQFALAEELRRASTQYSAAGAAGLVLDVASGEVLAAVSLPEPDPTRPGDYDGTRPDRLAGGVYELGSICKALTVALALDEGIADLDTSYDVREPLMAGPYPIKDLHPQGRPLTVREVFLHSSNVGAAMMALEAGAARQRAFLGKLGLAETMRTEAGALAAPMLPRSWGKAETITIAYGHGFAVAPLQFAVAAAALVNGGERIAPTFLTRALDEAPRRRALSAATSARMREIMRLNVTHASGTGRRAEADGYRVGGKTGTAEMPGRGGYQEKAVISSFLGAFPMDAPRFLTLVMLFEPQSGETGSRITAGLNAAPATARIVERIAPILGVLPRMPEAGGAGLFGAAAGGG